MIQANELRIGNLLIDVEDRICKVERIYEEDWTAYAIKGAITTGTPHPVPITEEILLKCGFVYPRKGSTVLMLTIAYINEESPCTLQVSGSGIQICRSGIGSMCSPVFYLHQLQNLYFALTGKELDVKL